ncbi:MAG TPA: FAD-dependent monooxygenase [Candidatus Dormibacteraeota bacterium]|jgi:2-polyprenyl-6-methoxyphenol hydroxylase-like FAD-dependent oxidoreductase|nr:FAD-dependent monooxygenase [Candidatus Dormibacteraeota bacterium]
MNVKRPHAMIAGGGLAGPCLANGLRRAGWEVTLFERDRGAATRGQGYRIYIEPEGDLALRACLPADLYQLALATSGRRGSGVTILDPELHVLQHFAFDGAAEAGSNGGGHLTVDRLALRQVLMAEIEGDVRYGAEVTGYEVLPGKGVRALLAGGSSVEGDVLIGADGPSSRIRTQLLPGAVVVDTGLRAIFGKVPLTEEVRERTPEAVLNGFSTVVGADGRFMPLAAHRFRTDPAEAAARLHPGVTFSDTRDYVMWVLGLPAARTGGDQELFSLDGRAQLDLVLGQLGDWHPDIAAAVGRSDPATVTATTLRTSVPVEPWASGPVTLIGDAIHCMIPSGIGAAVALRDAALLALRLTEAQAAGTSLVGAIHSYEREMLVYGFEAVAASQRMGQSMSTS